MFIIFKKPELYPAFHRKLTLLCQKRKQQLFYGILYKDTVIIIWTRGEHRLGTLRMSIVMFAGKSAKCQYQLHYCKLREMTVFTSVLKI